MSQYKEAFEKKANVRDAIFTAEEYETIRKALALAEAVEKDYAAGWQPIESAPRDGTSILMWGIDYTEAEIGKCVDIPITEGDVDSTYKAFVWNDGATSWDSFCDMTPTHWQPLPEPPSETEKQLKEK